MADENCVNLTGELKVINQTRWLWCVQFCHGSRNPVTFSRKFMRDFIIRQYRHLLRRSAKWPTGFFTVSPGMVAEMIDSQPWEKKPMQVGLLCSHYVKMRQFRTGGKLSRRSNEKCWECVKMCFSVMKDCLVLPCGQLVSLKLYVFTVSCFLICKLICHNFINVHFVNYHFVTGNFTYCIKERRGLIN